MTKWQLLVCIPALPPHPAHPLYQDTVMKRHKTPRRARRPKFSLRTIPLLIALTFAPTNTSAQITVIAPAVTQTIGGQLHYLNGRLKSNGNSPYYKADANTCDVSFGARVDRLLPIL